MTIRLLSVTLLLTLVTPAAAEDWAELLGYPADKKVVILHANDMGVCHESNAAIDEMLEKHPSASASAMAPCPWFAHAASLSSNRPGADVGLQITLNSEWPRYRWKPISRDNMTHTLVDGDGYFWRSVRQVMVNVSVEDAMLEARWQLLHAERLGLRPTHLTTHLGALYMRPDLAEAYLKFAQEQWIPAVVVDLTPEMIARFASQGFPLPDNLTRAIDSYPLPKLKDLRIVPRTETYEEKVELTLAEIERLPVGLSQVSFAPAHDTPALREMSPAWEQLAWDAQLMKEPRIAEALSSPDIVLTNWVEVMQRFDPKNR